MFDAGSQSAGPIVVGTLEMLDAFASGSGP